MFNIFKKQQPQLKEVATLKNPKNYPVEVLEIHKEFETAANRLLIEANDIIKQAASKDGEKVNRLEKFGFKQARQVVELKPLMQKADLSKEQLELLKHYSFHYPNNKFITEEQVEQICFKYNLVCGAVDKFKGFVPEKNLQEIESFKLRSGEVLRTHSLGVSSSYVGEVHYDEGEQARRYPSLYKKIDGNHVLQICAPIKDMDMREMTIERGYRMKEVVKHIPDPVVLQEVKGGYLIITAWGDEASDELVVNQKHN